MTIFLHRTSIAKPKINTKSCLATKKITHHIEGFRVHWREERTMSKHNFDSHTTQMDIFELHSSY